MIGYSYYSDFEFVIFFKIIMDSINKKCQNKKSKEIQQAFYLNTILK